MTARDRRGDGGPQELDVEALRARIRASASHARPDKDLDFLARSELRALRLELEYLKPELTLRELGVRSTIVVFGSTRLLDPVVARQRLEELERADGASEVDVERAHRALERSRYYEVGREFGRIVGSRCRDLGDERLIVVTGGGPGGMEAVSRGAFDVGADSGGFNIVLPREQEPNPYLTPELSFQFRYFALRKLHFMLRARALVALPGGYGTFDELFETLCLIQTGKRPPLPVVLVGEPFWRRAVDFDFLLEEEMIGPDDLSLFEFAESAEQIWKAITGWYRTRNRSLLEDEDVEP